ncbi:MAG: hypothetical protein A2806_03005 [Candidatus Terrybacteria bacterium RIFCSPHIGHO2_01_FULL_48_17]|uniref:Sortase n=1 Tax=Candidatus Terrybacteria bacterium RIFCSPHIGHO2_01_FULL_48_17 TaxID=1802362 RepID=A0A1G2PJB4_9BACT|nr:MAG: hypothetical protein A2806_03005 [Candidatus Terrybacteria bacterium RIFCSPHIGHO2_01_FULL_48_17]OHA53056.1 MAG: hypothetical protein A3A30_02630 [Candidatus Terrybacteria bacterium RIFCSPLOWO2_01_FULL_48_14]
MRLKILLRRAPFIAAFTGFALFATLLFYFIPQNEFVVDNVVVAPSKEQVSLSEGQGLGSPIRLKIPKINVDAAVEYVGLTPDGAMDVPKSQDDVAWYEPGTRPGEKGSAVIAGHYGWKGGEPSVFDSLYTLRKGDKLTIEDDKGEIITFVVRESRRYDPNVDASDVFGSSDGKAHLNLVTCEGEWDEVSQSYSKRLVVFTDKE